MYEGEGRQPLPEWWSKTSIYLPLNKINNTNKNDQNQLFQNAGH